MKPTEKQIDQWIKQMHCPAGKELNRRVEALFDSTQTKHQTRQASTLMVWRTIMKNKITRFAVAASILLVAGLLVWPFSPQKGQKDILSSLTLLTQAHAAEQTVFSGRGIVYLVNEFTLTPVPENTKFSKRLEELENTLAKNDMEKADTKNIETLKAWFSYSWFPFYSLGANGQLKCHKVEPAGAKPCVVTEKIWYDTMTGRFIRTMETDGKIIFANSFDGQNVCSSYDNAGILNIRKEPATADFKVPQNPADFLGMGAGVTDAFSRKDGYPPIIDVSEGSLDQTPVRVYKMGFKDIEGCAATYYLFKVGVLDNIIREIQCVVENQPTMNLRRVSTQTVTAAALSWDLKELNQAKTPVDVSSVVIRSDIENRNISAQQMVQTADFETYIFSINPAWTSEGQIHSGPDEGSSTSLAFSIIYPAKDGRHVILTQMQSLTRYHSGILKKMEEMGRPWPPSYTSPNGCKMYRSDEKGEKWWTEFAIKASGFEPVENRCGVIIQTPAQTFLALAVNGPVSDEEFHKLVDSLVPAREYQKH